MLTQGGGVWDDDVAVVRAVLGGVTHDVAPAPVRAPTHGRRGIGDRAVGPQPVQGAVTQQRVGRQRQVRQGHETADNSLVQLGQGVAGQVDGTDRREWQEGVAANGRKVVVGQVEHFELSLRLEDSRRERLDAVVAEPEDPEGVEHAEAGLGDGADVVVL